MQNRSEGAPPLTAQLGGDHSEGGSEADGKKPSAQECTTLSGDGIPKRRAQRAGRGPLPCQNSNNSTETADSRRVFDVQLVKNAGADELFPPASRRTAFALQVNVQAMCDEHGLAQVGFLTLTFADHVTDPKEAQRRLNSLTTHVLRPRYGRCIRVIERQKSGRIHYHLLVNVGRDIRTGVNFEEFERRSYRSAPMTLRCEWAFWRKTAKEYRFGRTELMPIRSTTEAIGRYVGKYIAKHLNFRQMRDKGVRLVSYSGPKIASTRFAWTSIGASLWRKKLGAFITMLHDSGVLAQPTTEAMAKKFGPRWAYKLRDFIKAFPCREEGTDGYRSEVHSNG